MKITLQQIDRGNEEVIIKYKQMTEQVEGIIKYIEGQGKKLFGTKDGQQFFLDIHKVIYLESVDGTTWMYTEKEVYKSDLTLSLCEILYGEEGFFRCNKSMIINIYRIGNLKSMSGNRIDVTMDNGEHVVISRHYAKELRSILRGNEL
ncbi:MAG: LytTR family transcriptional regulator DNA-binding domain-containing protein [Lachnospiraceae bacterium]|nr:LytTR family transcriptional regulator DNA-binding domain-containing protein [Lachnospiraceae bacterium]